MTFFPNDEAEVCFSVLGAGVGVCYGFDGWTGSGRDLEFQRSSRLRNLRYGAVGAFLAFLGDLRPILTTAPLKLFLLLRYFEGFFTAAVLVVTLVSLALIIKYWGVRRTGLGGFLAADFSPVMTYLFYGYNFYRATCEKSLQQAQQQWYDYQHKFVVTFLPAYQKQLSNAIAVVGAYVSHPEEHMRKGVANQILKCISATVAGYYCDNDNAGDLQVNANYMIEYQRASPPPDLESRLRFASPITNQPAVVELVAEVHPDDFSNPCPPLTIGLPLRD